MEQERREGKELVVGVEEVSAALGIEHKVSFTVHPNQNSFPVTLPQSCNLLANNSSDGYVVPWLRHPGDGS
jgi:hypothetical protein